jgi:hypothetical protein
MDNTKGFSYYAIRITLQILKNVFLDKTDILLNLGNI